MVPHESVLDLIGNTPVVDVSNLSPNPRVKLMAKLEGQNPFGSVKDRIAKQMILEAEKDGRLQPGQTLIEPSSGNTGIALAAIAKSRGYPIKILMPTSVSIERRQMLEVFNVLLAGALLATLTYYGVIFAQFTGMRPLPMTGVSSAWATGALPVGFALMLITLAEHLAARFRGRSPVVDPTEPREVM